MLRKSEWDDTEDGRPARSHINTIWETPDCLQWHLEIREPWHSVGSYRLGELTMRGNFNGKLTLAIDSLFDLEKD